MTGTAHARTPSTLSRILKASCRRNIPAAVGGGGILASIFAKNVISPEYEIAGMFVGLLLAYAFVVHVNMKEEASAIKAPQA